MQKISIDELVRSRLAVPDLTGEPNGWDDLSEMLDLLLPLRGPSVDMAHWQDTVPEPASEAIEIVS